MKVTLFSFEVKLPADENKTKVSLKMKEEQKGQRKGVGVYRVERGEGINS